MVFTGWNFYILRCIREIYYLKRYILDQCFTKSNERKETEIYVFVCIRINSDTFVDLMQTFTKYDSEII